MTNAELLTIETYLSADSFRMTELVPVAENLLAEVRRLHGDADRNARFVEKVRGIVAFGGVASAAMQRIVAAHREIYNAPCKPVKEKM